MNRCNGVTGVAHITGVNIRVRQSKRDASLFRAAGIYGAHSTFLGNLFRFLNLNPTHEPAKCKSRNTLERNMLRKMAFFAHFRPRFRGSVRENTFSGKSNLNLNLQMQCTKDKKTADRDIKLPMRDIM